MIGLLSFMLVIGLGLLVHEFGHFLAAKKFGVAVPEFSIGMGPALWKFKKEETDYVLRLLPIGGFVAMASILEGDSHDGCFEAKPRWARAIILLAGPVMNFALAFLFILSIGLFQGQPTITNELSRVIPGEAASVAGLESGDLIISYEGMPITNGEELIAAIHQTPGVATVELIRDGEVLQKTITPSSRIHNGQQISQVGVEVVTTYNFSLGYAFEFGIGRFTQVFNSLVDSLRSLATGEVGVSQLSGPLGVYQMASMVAHHSIYAVLLLAAVINVNLGIFNLLPLPALDGGRLLFVAAGAFFKKGIPVKVESAVHMVGFFLFMGLFVFTFINDLWRMRG
ncbi:MAG: RIP metalloprotease RseP [Turicibacter sp.]|nr:RIP metalloprotease RseP [Turicibacter sp.]